MLSNVKHASILSTRLPQNLESAKLATLVTLEAAPGQEKNLEDLLTSAASIVEQTEPNTLFWIALKFDNNNYGIFDLFATETGRSEHFAGKVAGILQEKSAILVKGGWDNGVVPNVHHFSILASK